MYKTLPITITSRAFAFVCATLVFLIFIAFGEMLLKNHADEERNKQRDEAMSYTSTLRARTERELNSLLYLSSGLGSYLVVRNDSIQPKEINDILAVLYRNSSHVRNFGIAIGYRLTFVYPLEGNERAIGLYYPDQPAQWPVIQKIAKSNKSALAGPVKLVQGGSGLIYRVPLSIQGNYWGMLSTVIDTDSFFRAIIEGADNSNYEFAVRGKDGLGIQGDSVWGNLALFGQQDTIVQKIDIPGGSWFIAVKPKTDDPLNKFSIAVRMVSLILGGFIAWMMYMLIRSRADLTYLAMYDGLTGLPNRLLLEDRADIAFARQRRNPTQLCALLFFDLDGFKDINDKYGHKAGDVILRVTAERAKSIVRLNDTVARWGGDEFIILLEEVTQSALENLMLRLRDELESPIDFEEWKLKVGVSIGFAIYPETGGSLDEILKIADQKMYEDKNQKNRGAGR